MLWQHFMLQNDKWRGKGRAEVQLKHTDTQRVTMEKEGLNTAYHTPHFQLVESKILINIGTSVQYSFS